MPLVRLLGTRRSGRRQLRQTNVIANDRHYRAAGIVWNAYERGDRAIETADERQARLAERHEAFSLYAVALIVRALSDLGYRPDEDRAPAVGGTLRLKGAAIWATIELNWSRDGTVTLRSEGRSTRFIPLLDLVGPDDRLEEAVARWSAVEAEITSPSGDGALAPFRVMAALPGVAAQSLTSAGADGPNGRALVTAVPVTPLETTSLERVARAVADAMRERQGARSYPAVVRADNPLPRRIIRPFSTLDTTLRSPPCSSGSTTMCSACVGG